MHKLIINEFGQIEKNPQFPLELNKEQQQEIFRNAWMDDQFIIRSQIENEELILECFDFPLRAEKINFIENHLIITAQFELQFHVDSSKLSLDFLDQICGLTTSKCPFKLTLKAQEKLFDECDEFDDESFTLAGQRFETPPFYIVKNPIYKSQFWSEIYNEPKPPGWDLGEPSPAFVDMLPRLKLPKSRILVLGCGEGHDAAFFAEAGHVVTAVDFSEVALEKAQKKYSHLTQIQWHNLDVFNLPQEWNNSFDLVVEHTCFCAILPERRDELIKVWRRMLHEEGQLIAVFFALLKRSGPPYGSSEFELRSRLEKSFQFLFWGRWNKSVSTRENKELFVFAKKR